MTATSPPLVPATGGLRAVVARQPVPAMLIMMFVIGWAVLLPPALAGIEYCLQGFPRPVERRPSGSPWEAWMTGLVANWTSRWQECRITGLWCLEAARYVGFEFGTGLSLLGAKGSRVQIPPPRPTSFQTPSLKLGTSSGRTRVQPPSKVG